MFVTLYREHTVHPIDFVLFYFIVVSRQLWLLTSKGGRFDMKCYFTSFYFSFYSFSSLFSLFLFSSSSLFSFFFLFCLRLQHGKIAGPCVAGTVKFKSFLTVNYKSRYKTGTMRVNKCIFLCQYRCKKLERYKLLHIQLTGT